MWVIDQACSVKMAGYWPSSFFACLWTETKSITRRGFVIWDKTLKLHLARSGSQSQREIRFILLAYGARYIIIMLTTITSVNALACVE